MKPITRLPTMLILNSRYLKAADKKAEVFTSAFLALLAFFLRLFND